MKNKTQQVVAYYWRCVRKYPRFLAGTLLSVPATVLINYYLPQLILADVLNKLGGGQYTSDVWQSFGPQLVAYAGLLLLGIGGWRLVDYFTWKLESNIQQDIAKAVFNHMLNQTADFHANNFSGSLVSQNNKLLSGYIRMADTTIYQAYPMLVGIIIATIILLPKAPLFAVLLVIFSALYLAVAFLISRPVQRLSAKYAAAESKQTGLLADVIANVMTIKSFAGGVYERHRFHGATEVSKKKLMEFARLHKRQMNTLGFFSRTISGLSLAMAVISVVLFGVELGTAYLILSYTATVVDQLFNFSNNSLRNYNRVVGDAADMVEILAQAPTILDPAKPEPVRIRDGAIAFQQVTFTHSGSDDAIFENFSINLAAGEKVGLVGHSGSGKTTFTRLLLRFSDVDSGGILIDGQNIAHITQDDLHRHIAYVPQEPLLFHRTIEENISYGKHGATQEEILQAAKFAHAHEFIKDLPQGYETLVGERGVKLSGGQRQRVAIARAMLKNAPILVLDEATSALDSESEVLIQDALWKLMEGRTTIVIAHRLSTIQKMDRIIVLDKGKIVEEGSHRTLLKNNGTYAKLWAHQSGGFIDE